MATIKFKAKAQTMYSVDDVPLYQFVQVPEFKSSHCDMDEFRKNDRFHANSALFPNVLARIRDAKFKHGVLRLDELPEGVTVDATGFLVTVTIEVHDRC